MGDYLVCTFAKARIARLWYDDCGKYAYNDEDKYQLHHCKGMPIV
jgi:hypothetical protein